ncbi:imidazole glycerol phosphate synthase subunit HisH [Thiomicrospira sp. ALE5]|uniref:imidazole glycerol phosphate synthase subunit HisH n=1 Tax=Thiomicrospira sp. ALE5 TaxID=748650 RepID=UPI0008E9D8E0|nr:imidazole glycerol phosphate synthase subunit HisH [Thiomicrospira sp. ALE5]SFR59412.1 glutamine amidotransferase [Thiomicrospira sp. ALE5]
MKRVTLIDYGAGNLLNVQRAFEHVGVRVEIATEAKQIEQAEHLVFPGVGAFPEAMRRLQQKNLIGAIQQAAVDTPFLGICLGMQMMLDQGEEFESTPGLGLIAGQVKALPTRTLDGKPMKVPHMGWELIRSNHQAWSSSLLNDIPPQNAFYFVHSYYADVQNVTDQLAVFDFGGHSITAAIQREHLMGCQFHPEKSGLMGLKVIERFLDI